MPDASPFRPLDSETALQKAVQHSGEEPVVLFKHSTACSLSAAANDELRRLSENGERPVYRLIVQKSRALSNDIAERFGVRHESPQALVLHQQEVVFDASHRAVTAEALRAAAQKTEEG